MPAAPPVSATAARMELNIDFSAGATQTRTFTMIGRVSSGQHPAFGTYTASSSPSNIRAARSRAPPPRLCNQGVLAIEVARIVHENASPD
jgi:hypothetical protein